MHSVQYGTQTVEYKILRKPTLKNTYINVDKDGVLIKTNTITTEDEIAKIVSKKSAWIIKHLQTYRAKVFESEICTGSRLYYLGKSYYVELQKEAGQKSIEVRFIRSKFIIKAPSKASQLALYNAIDVFYKKKAIVKITPLAKKWAKIMNVTPEHISFRKANKRWGSCSLTNRISFNYHLMKLPTSLIEYVVVHELSHIKHKNHSNAFWVVVAEYMSDYREKEAKIKKFERMI